MIWAWPRDIVPAERAAPPSESVSEGCRCYTHWGTAVASDQPAMYGMGSPKSQAYGFKPKSNLVWLTAT